MPCIKMDNGKYKIQRTGGGLYPKEYSSMEECKRRVDQMEKFKHIEGKTPMTGKFIKIKVKAPGDFDPDSLKTKQVANGVRGIMGKMMNGNKGKMTMQSLMFDKDKFDMDKALKWCKDNGYNVMMEESYPIDVSTKRHVIAYKSVVGNEYYHLTSTSNETNSDVLTIHYPSDGSLAGKVLKINAKKEKSNEYEVIYVITDVELVDIKTAINQEATKPIKDFEYLLHHIEKDEKGNETTHHCFLYDHLGNMYEQKHIDADNKTHHAITGLENTQEVCWSDQDAKDNNIKPKAMKAGMTLKQKAKEW